MKVRPFFVPGSNWLYYKIYVGTGYSNRFLLEHIFPLVKDYIKNKLIAQWFFMRYADPDAHLRIRLYCGDSSKLDVIISGFATLFDELLSKCYITDVQIGTYQRELSRYGKEHIIVVENLWCYESHFVLTSILKHSNGEAHVISMIAATHIYLNCFYEYDQDMLEHTHQNFLLYARKFGIIKAEKRKLSDKYRNIQNKLNKYISFELDKCRYLGADSKYRLYLKSFTKDFDAEVNANLSSSLIHMLINRGFDKSQRQMEMVVYHHLWKYYRYRMARFGKINHEVNS